MIMPGIMSEGSVQAFVAKPESNPSDFDSRLKKVHRLGVANNVGRNPLSFRSRTGRQGAPHTLQKDVGGPGGGQRSTTSAGEHDAVAIVATRALQGRALAI